MKEKDFRRLLKRAAAGKENAEEKELLEKFITSKLKTGEELPFSSNQQAVLEKTLSAIRFRRNRKLIYNSLKYAAVLLLCTFTAYQFFTTSTLKNNIEPTQFVEVTTQKGERKTIILPDSSIVVLNANSSCKYPKVFSGNQRLINLKGEGFFEVTHDETKPFIVKTKNLATTVLGTSFDIQEKQSSVSVTVSTGRVKVDQLNNSQSEEIILTKNKRFELNLKTNASVLSTTNAELSSNWSREILAFENENLGQVFKKLEVWYNVDIDCQSKALLQRTVKARYEKKSLDYVLEDLKFILDINYEIKGNKITITN